MISDFNELSTLSDDSLCQMYDDVISDDTIHHDMKRRLCYVMASRMWLRWQQREVGKLN